MRTATSHSIQCATLTQRPAWLQVLIEHAPVSHQLMANVSAGGSVTSYHSSIVGWGPHMLLMSPVSLLHARLIPWAERLAALKELGVPSLPPQPWHRRCSSASSPCTALTAAAVAMRCAGDWAGAILLGLQARDTMASRSGSSPSQNAPQGAGELGLLPTALRPAGCQRLARHCPPC